MVSRKQDLPKVRLFNHNFWDIDTRNEECNKVTKTMDWGLNDRQAYLLLRNLDYLKLLCHRCPSCGLSRWLALKLRLGMNISHAVCRHCLFEFAFQTGPGSRLLLVLVYAWIAGMYRTLLYSSLVCSALHRWWNGPPFDWTLVRCYSKGSRVQEASWDGLQIGQQI